MRLISDGLGAAVDALYEACIALDTPGTIVSSGMLTTMQDLIVFKVSTPVQSAAEKSVSELAYASEGGGHGL
jgi:hypothetical protein